MSRRLALSCLATALVAVVPVADAQSPPADAARDMTFFVTSTGLALLQFDELWRVAVVVGIFLFGQAVEGNVLTPKLVGDKVGLHAVWVMFALLAGGSLFGFVGVLLAVPVAAVIGVLTRFALRQYLSSPYYRGIDAER